MKVLSSRREFFSASSAWGLAAWGFPFPARLWAAELAAAEAAAGQGKSGAVPVVLPEGSAPAALEAGWFPNRMFAFVWRNQGLVPLDRMAAVLGCGEADVAAVAGAMGLEKGEPPEEPLRRRCHLTVIRRNWHLLPYDQLLVLLGWTAEQLAYTLREDDFFFIKLGSLKPRCGPLRWSPPTEAEKVRAGEIAGLVREHFPPSGPAGRDPLFSFIDKLKSPPDGVSKPRVQPAGTAPNPPLRMGYSYFALCGDPLLDPALDPYPDGLLERLAGVGENAVWLHVELPHLSPVPWAEDANIEKRRAALKALAARAGRHGIRLFLYFNEPRALTKDSPVFTAHPDWRGVEENGYQTVCTSVPAVRDGLRDAVADLCRAVPELGGFFTITASENLTHCWSHGQGAQCPRCREKSAGEVIAGVSVAIAEGIRLAGGRQRYLAWDWGWPDDQALDIIARLPAMAELMSVSEWALPIKRGGVESTVGEYSISSIGPGPRARRHWEAAAKRGLRVVAKIQCGNTWEMSAVPWLPVVENITRHATALREAGVNDIMLGWTLGCHPSPNLAAIDVTGSGGSLETLALQRHGPDPATAAAAVGFWSGCSRAFQEFPYHIGTVYSAPLQMGPANPLWPAPTGYAACMVGIPYDDLNAWRSIYPPDIFAGQLEKVAAGFEAALVKLRLAVPTPPPSLVEEMRFAEAAAIHFASVANQSRAVPAREAADHRTLRRLCRAEMGLAIRLHALQNLDSRIGFEASNQYYYTPRDLMEKVINCAWIESRLPEAGK